MRYRVRQVRGIPGPGQLFIDRKRGPPSLARVMERGPDIKRIRLGVRGVEADMAGIGILIQNLSAPSAPPNQPGAKR